MDFKVLVFVFNIFCLMESVKSRVQLDRDVQNPAFDPDFYNQYLDSELCSQQLSYIRQNNTSLWIQFLEAGLRIPRSISTGNLVDLGNYHQCLGIRQLLDETEDSVIEGKYCLLDVPLNQNFTIPITLIDGFEIINNYYFNANSLQIDDIMESNLNILHAIKGAVNADGGIIDNKMRSSLEGMGNVQFTLAICVPKTCTTEEGLSGLLFNMTELGFIYSDGTCRLKNDKPWAPVDFVAIVIFSTLGLVTLISTCFDLHSMFILRNDPKSISTLGRSFSLYTNSRRLTTYVSSSGALECLDGIRAIAMMWIILGHTATTLPPFINGLDALDWMLSRRSLWLTGTPITVDTFFLLSGLLVVYTTAGKLSEMKLLKNLHLFYLYRILRMFPLLAATILLQASFLHWIADGPLWDQVVFETNNCRLNWWINLLYLQNYVSTSTMCLGPTWFLAIDMHLHIISPVILFWVLSNKNRTSWIALSVGLILSLTVGTTYSFIKKFPGASIVPAREEESVFYSSYYYINTLTRASPFFVGMMFGYFLHRLRDKKLRLSMIQTISLWVLTLGINLAAFCATEPMKSIDWDNQIYESIVNSFMRPIWAATVGSIIVLCVKGYGGVVNWLLSLQMWKLLSRVSFAMYLIHYSIMFVVTGTNTAPIRFSVMGFILLFLSYYSLVFVIGFFMTLVIDSPFSTIFKLLLEGKTTRRKVAVSKKEGADVHTVPNR